MDPAEPVRWPLLDTPPAIPRVPARLVPFVGTMSPAWICTAPKARWWWRSNAGSSSRSSRSPARPPTPRGGADCRGVGRRPVGGGAVRRDRADRDGGDSGVGRRSAWPRGPRSPPRQGAPDRDAPPRTVRGRSPRTRLVAARRRPARRAADPTPLLAEGVAWNGRRAMAFEPCCCNHHHPRPRVRPRLPPPQTPGEGEHVPADVRRRARVLARVHPVAGHGSVVGRGRPGVPRPSVPPGRPAAPPALRQRLAVRRVELPVGGDRRSLWLGPRRTVR